MRAEAGLPSYNFVAGVGCQHSPYTLTTSSASHDRARTTRPRHHPLTSLAVPGLLTASLALDLNVDGLDVSDIDGAMVKNFIEELAQEARRIAGPRRRIHIVYERSGALSRKSTLDRLHKLFDGMVLPLPDHSPDLNLCDLTVFPLFQVRVCAASARASQVKTAISQLFQLTKLPAPSVLP